MRVDLHPVLRASHDEFTVSAKRQRPSCCCSCPVGVVLLLLGVIVQSRQTNSISLGTFAVVKTAAEQVLRPTGVCATSNWHHFPDRLDRNLTLLPPRIQNISWSSGQVSTMSRKQRHLFFALTCMCSAFLQRKAGQTANLPPCARPGCKNAQVPVNRESHIAGGCRRVQPTRVEAARRNDLR